MGHLRSWRGREISTWPGPRPEFVSYISRWVRPGLGKQDCPQENALRKSQREQNCGSNPRLNSRDWVQWSVPILLNLSTAFPPRIPPSSLRPLLHLAFGRIHPLVFFLPHWSLLVLAQDKVLVSICLVPNISISKRLRAQVLVLCLLSHLLPVVSSSHAVLSTFW